MKRELYKTTFFLLTLTTVFAFGSCDLVEKVFGYEKCVNATAMIDGIPFQKVSYQSINFAFPKEDAIYYKGKSNFINGVLILHPRDSITSRDVYEIWFNLRISKDDIKKGCVFIVHEPIGQTGETVWDIYNNWEKQSSDSSNEPPYESIVLVRKNRLMPHFYNGRIEVMEMEWRKNPHRDNMDYYYTLSFEYKPFCSTPELLPRSIKGEMRTFILDD